MSQVAAKARAALRQEQLDKPPGADWRPPNSPFQNKGAHSHRKSKEAKQEDLQPTRPHKTQFSFRAGEKLYHVL
jgi:hypothetical protein